jgi:hypothetical protein
MGVEDDRRRAGAEACDDVHDAGLARMPVDAIAEPLEEVGGKGGDGGRVPGRERRGDRDQVAENLKEALGERSSAGHARFCRGEGLGP